MSNDILIRLERPEEYRATEHLVREAFWNVYCPGCDEHFLLHKLRDEPVFIRQLDFVMEQNGILMGQVAFARQVIQRDDGVNIPIVTFGPISIAPAFQRQGYGKKLLDHALAEATKLGYGAVCIEGNIRFYETCGFTYAHDFGIRYRGLTEGDDDSFFLCKELIPGYLLGAQGEYGPSECYFVSKTHPEEFAAFEASFPPKEKKRLPGQIFAD